MRWGIVGIHRQGVLCRLACASAELALAAAKSPTELAPGHGDWPASSVSGLLQGGLRIRSSLPSRRRASRPRSIAGVANSQGSAARIARARAAHRHRVLSWRSPDCWPAESPPGPRHWEQRNRRRGRRAAGSSRRCECPCARVRAGGSVVVLCASRLRSLRLDLSAGFAAIPQARTLHWRRKRQRCRDPPVGAQGHRHVQRSDPHLRGLGFTITRRLEFGQCGEAGANRVVVDPILHALGVDLVNRNRLFLERKRLLIQQCVVLLQFGPPESFFGRSDTIRSCASVR